MEEEYLSSLHYIADYSLINAHAMKDYIGLYKMRDFLRWYVWPIWPLRYYFCVILHIFGTIFCDFYTFSALTRCFSSTFMIIWTKQSGDSLHWAAREICTWYLVPWSRYLTSCPARVYTISVRSAQGLLIYDHLNRCWNEVDRYLHNIMTFTMRNNRAHWG